MYNLAALYIMIIISHHLCKAQTTTSSDTVAKDFAKELEKFKDMVNAGISNLEQYKLKTKEHLSRDLHKYQVNVDKIVEDIKKELYKLRRVADLQEQDIKTCLGNVDQELVATKEAAYSKLSENEAKSEGSVESILSSCKKALPNVGTLKEDLMKEFDRCETLACRLDVFTKTSKTVVGVGVDVYKVISGGTVKMADVLLNGMQYMSTVAENLGKDTWALYNDKLKCVRKKNIFMYA